MPLLELSAGDYDVTIAPDIGGSLRSFTWKGEPLLRTASGLSVLDAACFPLVPFSNRIANGRFEFDGEVVQLAPNFPGRDHPHPLHGFGWVSAWDVVSANASSAELEHSYPGGEWPWPYVARQSIRLSEDRLELELSVRNLSFRPMPAGLGFHPYFPCDAATILRAYHQGEWQTDADCLPTELHECDAPVDWWAGAPIASRPVDTVYSGRAGRIDVIWPDRNLTLSMQPSPVLKHTGIFVPAAADWFCVEPVSQSTNAFNAPERTDDFAALEPGGVIQISLSLLVQTNPQVIYPKI